MSDNKGGSVWGAALAGAAGGAVATVLLAVAAVQSGEYRKWIETNYGKR